MSDLDGNSPCDSEMNNENVSFKAVIPLDTQPQNNPVHDSQYTFCDTNSQSKANKENFSESLFSQETQEYCLNSFGDSGSQAITASNPSLKDVVLTVKSVPEIILDNESKFESPIIIPDFSNDNKQIACNKRKYMLGYSDTHLKLFPELSPIPQGRPLSKRRRSCSSCPLPIPARSLLKRCLSVDAASPTTKLSISIIHEENNSECLDGSLNQGTTESQNITLQLSLSPGDIGSLSKRSDKSKESTFSSEPCIVKERSEIVKFSKIHRPHSDGYAYSSESDGNSQRLTIPKRINLGNRGIDQDSTASISLDSSNDAAPPEALSSRIQRNLSNGCSSSTPENAPLTQSALFQRRFLVSDSEGDGTLDYGETAHDRASESTASPLGASTSPLRNGHSSISRTVPVFNVQMYCDENDEFLSLFIVKTNNDLGAEMCKEYQRTSRRLTIDPYAGDVSKSTSPASATGSGPSSGPLQLPLPLPPRSSFLSAASSASASSSRTSDGAFVIPPRPRRDFSQNPITVRGAHALKQKLDEIALGISEYYGEPSAIDDTTETAFREEASCQRGTPKSSKKRLQLKSKRSLSSKSERVEETQNSAVGIHSPEMIPSDIGGATLPTRHLVSPSSPGTPRNSRTPRGPHPRGTLVLAKWVDKRYYSGKVERILDADKYLIEFDDGQTKTLLENYIIFGDARKLPIIGQSCYAMVDEEQNYEPSLVLSVEENEHGTVCYKCTTDRHDTVCVAATEIYLTEDQARLTREAGIGTEPVTPRRRHRELDLHNILDGPRVRPRPRPPASPQAGTSGALACGSRTSRRGSESSEGGDIAGRAPSALEEVGGVQPELHRTPRKMDGVKARMLVVKGASKRNAGKKKFENGSDADSLLGPIPAEGSNIFNGLHFLLTCSELPRLRDASSISPVAATDNESQSSCNTSEREDKQFDTVSFNKERLKEQLEIAGGIVYSHFEEIPKKHYSVCYLIAPRPCVTAKYIQCLAANIRALSPLWVIRSCARNRRMRISEYALPAGWSLSKRHFVDWEVSGYRSGRGSASPFQDKLILLCSDNADFGKFWERVCTLAGGKTRTVDAEHLDLSGGHVLVTECDCPHMLQNKAHHDRVPLVSTIWVVQCLIEGTLCRPDASHKYDFMYNDND